MEKRGEEQPVLLRASPFALQFAPFALVFPPFDDFLLRLPEVHVTVSVRVPSGGERQRYE